MYTFLLSVVILNFVPEFFLLSHARDKTKKQLSLFLYRAQNLSSLLFLSTNITLSTLLILVVCRRVSYELRNRPRSPWSLCGLVVRASERGIRRSEVRFLMGTQNFFFVPRSWQDEKTSFLILHRAQNLPSLLFCQKHYAIDIADPSSMQDACHMNFVIDLAHRGVSVAQW